MPPGVVYCLSKFEDGPCEPDHFLSTRVLRASLLPPGPTFGVWRKWLHKWIGRMLPSLFQLQSCFVFGVAGPVLVISLLKISHLVSVVDCCSTDSHWRAVDLCLCERRKLIVSLFMGE